MKTSTKTRLGSSILPTTLFLIALASFASVSINSSPAQAESTSSSANASVTVSDTIRLTLTGGDLVINNLTPGTSADSNIITATVTSNSPYGFHLSATTGTKNGTTSLVNTADSNFSFTNLNANKASLNDFSDNTWGYSYSTDNGTNWISGDYGTALAGYNGLSLDNDDSGATGTTLYNSDSYTNSTAVKFKIGAKSSQTQASGTYTGTVNFYAVTNPKPIITIANATTMQEVEACPESVPMETVYVLTDSRDNQTYKVARLKDGKCWMVENLNLAGGTTLSADNTDVTSAYISSFSTSNNLTKTGNTIVLPASSITGFDVPNYSYVYNSGNKTSNCVSPGCYSYYSWDAATLGSGRAIVTDNTDAEQSVCPKGWKLPSTYNGSGTAAEAADFRALMIGYGGSTLFKHTIPLQLQLALLCMAISAPALLLISCSLAITSDMAIHLIMAVVLRFIGAQRQILTPVELTTSMFIRVVSTQLGEIIAIWDLVFAVYLVIRIRIGNHVNLYLSFISSIREHKEIWPVVSLGLLVFNMLFL